MENGKKGLAVVVILLFIGVSVVPATGTLLEKSTLSFNETLYVGGSGSGNYTRIQDAINDASDGDTVYVFSGIYYENIEINKSIDLIGKDKNDTIIDGGETYRKNVVVLDVDNITVRNLTLQRSCPIYGCGVMIRSDNNHIMDCNLLNNGYYGNAYIGWGCRNNVISRCYFHITESWGLYLDGASDNTISHCTFIEQTVLLYRAKNTVVTDCEMLNPVMEGVQLTLWCEGNTIMNCRIYSAGTGICFYESGRNNSVKNCEIINSRSYGIYVSGEQEGFEVTGCNITGTRIVDGIIFWTYMEDCVISDCRFINNAQGGIVFFNVIRNVKISQCHFISNVQVGVGILFYDRFRNVEISQCHFEGNKYGIEMHRSNFFNKFYHNNFMNSEKQIQTGDVGLMFIMFNSYMHNYWIDHCGIEILPYHVFGLLNWDLSPMMEPYDY